MSDEIKSKKEAPVAPKVPTNSNLNSIALIILAVAVLVGVVAYAWNTKPATTATGSGNTPTTETTPAASGDVDKLGPKEVLLTPDNFTDVTTKNKLVLVDMYSPTCPHCIKISPILTDISNEYAGKLTVAKMSVATDANRNFILNWDKEFQYVPAITIFKDGKKVDSFTGERTKQEFKDLIAKYL